MILKTECGYHSVILYSSPSKPLWYQYVISRAFKILDIFQSKPQEVKGLRGLKCIYCFKSLLSNLPTAGCSSKALFQSNKFFVFV